jgi:hypothetical protein
MQPPWRRRRLAPVRAFLVTAACVILSGLLVTLMAEGPHLGMFKSSLPATMGLAADT